MPTASTRGATTSRLPDGAVTITQVSGAQSRESIRPHRVATAEWSGLLRKGRGLAL
jgi:hypothetical protein